MSQIPAFLRSLSSLVRDLVRTGRAVHVTAKTADELDLLAGLPWTLPEIGFVGVSGTAVGAGGMINTTKDITIHAKMSPTPADIALGWLRAAHPFPGVANPADVYYSFAEPRDYVIEATRRAAECAELALLAVSVLPQFEGDEPGVPRPYDGTLEGARAAWDFVAAQLDAKPQRIEIIIRPTSEYVSATGWKALADTYRRELEAMK